MSELAFEHQGEEIATDRASARQTVVRSQHDLGRKSEDFPVNRRIHHGRHRFMFGNKRSRYDNIKAWLGSAFGNPLARSVDLASPHERACSAISARAWRLRRLRCLRNMAPSLASLFRLRSLSAYWCSAVRTRAVRLLRLDELSANSSRSFEVASSMAIFFIGAIIAVV